VNLLPDPFNSPEYLPVLSTVGLKPVDKSLPVRLSLLLAFNDFRRSQVGRSLECLARQTWREFEVLVHDNGSSLPMEPVYEIFRPYLRLTTLRAERTEWCASPSFGIKELLPLARGQVIAVSGPEIMLAEDACQLLYSAHKDPPPGSLRYIISQPGIPMGGRPTWVSLKVGFVAAAGQRVLDGIDWHTRLRAVEEEAAFWTHREGSNCLTNREVLAYREWPWNLVFSAPRTDRVWDDLPVFKTQVPVDAYLLSYRHVRGYVDIVPPGFHGYHQDHYRLWVWDTDGENDSCAAPRLRAWAAQNHVPLCPAPDPGGVDLSPEMSNPTGGPVYDDGWPTREGPARQAKAAEMLAAAMAAARREQR
jgi:hypothetical protein